MIFCVTFPEESQSAANTLLQIFAANSNRPFSLLEFSFTMQGVDAAAAPILFELIRQTSAGTGGTSVTPVKLDQTDPHSIEATCLRKPTGSNWTGQPTSTDLYVPVFAHPQGGFIYQAQWRGKIKVQGGNRIGIRLPNAPGAAVDMVGYAIAEE